MCYSFFFSCILESNQPMVPWAPVQRPHVNCVFQSWAVHHKTVTYIVLGQMEDRVEAEFLQGS